MAAADLPAAAALDAGVVQIGVVELDLHKFQLRVVGEDLVQHGGLVVEGHAHVAHLSLGFQLLHCLKSAAGREFFVIVGVQCVEQVVVEILHAAGVQLGLQKGADVRLGLETAVGQLVGQRVGAAGMPLHQRGADGGLAFAVQIGVGGVKIGEAPFQKQVHHLAELGVVHFAVFQHGQAHTAKAQRLARDTGFHRSLLFILFIVPHFQIRRNVL